MLKVVCCRYLSNLTATDAERSEPNPARLTTIAHTLNFLTISHGIPEHQAIQHIQSLTFQSPPNSRLNRLNLLFDPTTDTQVRPPDITAQFLASATPQNCAEPLLILSCSYLQHEASRSIPSPGSWWQHLPIRFRR